LKKYGAIFLQKKGRARLAQEGDPLTEGERVTERELGKDASKTAGKRGGG